MISLRSAFLVATMALTAPALAADITVDQIITASDLIGKIKTEAANLKTIEAIEDPNCVIYIKVPERKPSCCNNWYSSSNITCYNVNSDNCNAYQYFSVPKDVVVTAMKADLEKKRKSLADLGVKAN